MAIQIKDVGTLQQKYVNRAVNAQTDYKAGVMSPRASQSGNAIAAAGNWQAAVTSGTALARFKSGLAKSGDAGWQQGASTKGAAHYPEGVRGGAAKWGTNTQPYLQNMASLSLPPKGIRGSDANIQRVAAIAASNHNLKNQLAGAK